MFCGIADFTGPGEAEATARVSGGREGGGSPSMGGGQELQSWAGHEGSGLRHASAAVPLALLHPTTVPHTRAPVPGTCPASLWEGAGHRSQSLAPSEVQGRALAQRAGGGQRWGNPKDEGRGERGSGRGKGSFSSLGRGFLRPLALPT